MWAVLSPPEKDNISSPRICFIFRRMSGFGQQPLEDEEPDNIWVACTNGDEARVRELLGQGVSVNAQDEHGFSPLHAAASYGQIDLLRLLLTLGANVHIRDTDGDTPLHACETAEVFEILIAAGADPRALNAVGDTILQKAIEDENEDLIKYLIEKGHAPEGFTWTSADEQEIDFENWVPPPDDDEDEEEENKEEDTTAAMEG